MITIQTKKSSLRICRFCTEVISSCIRFGASNNIFVYSYSTDYYYFSGRLLYGNRFYLYSKGIDNKTCKMLVQSRKRHFARRRGA